VDPLKQKVRERSIALVERSFHKNGRVTLGSLHLINRCLFSVGRALPQPTLDVGSLRRPNWEVFLDEPGLSSYPVIDHFRSFDTVSRPFIRFWSSERRKLGTVRASVGFPLFQDEVL
jgi:hypothetical protein